MKTATEINFQTQANRQRQRMRVFIQFVVTGALLIGAALLVPDKLSVWIGVPGMGLLFGGMIIFFTVPGLRCPDCGKSAEDFDRFCPVCGTDGLRRILSAAKCDGCHHTLDHYKFRNYTVHFCTHCGKLLDRRGVGPEVLSKYEERV